MRKIIMLVPCDPSKQVSLGKSLRYLIFHVNREIKPRIPSNSTVGVVPPLVTRPEPPETLKISGERK